MTNAFALGQSAFTDAVPKYDPSQSLPQSISFDCSYTEDAPSSSVYIFQHAMRIPRHFEIDEVDGNALALRALLPSPFGEATEFSFAAIHYGHIGDRLYPEWENLDDGLSNWLALAVRGQNSELPTGETVYEVVLTKNLEFLQITSIVPIEWKTLLKCFH